jgi:membrane associated rhomboid family serine protease
MQFQLTITLIIIIITVIVSIGAFSNNKMMNDLIFHPPAISRYGQWYRFFSSGLIHADAMHLIFNMISLYFFGPIVEKVMVDFFGNSGKIIYLVMYVTALMVSLLPTYFNNKDNSAYYGLGASGAVSAVIFAGMLIAPTENIYLFLAIGIPGFIFAPLYLFITAYLERRGGDRINHSAHLWGSLYGLTFMIAAGFAAGFNFITYCVEQIGAFFQGR